MGSMFEAEHQNAARQVDEVGVSGWGRRGSGGGWGHGWGDDEVGEQSGRQGGSQLGLQSVARQAEAELDGQVERTRRLAEEAGPPPEACEPPIVEGWWLVMGAGHSMQMVSGGRILLRGMTPSLQVVFDAGVVGDAGARLVPAPVTEALMEMGMYDETTEDAGNQRGYIRGVPQMNDHDGDPPPGEDDPAFRCPVCSERIAPHPVRMAHHLRQSHRRDDCAGPDLAAFGRMVGKKVPGEIQPWLMGARLVALLKPDGGVRPVTCGERPKWDIGEPGHVRAAYDTAVPLLAEIGLELNVRKSVVYSPAGACAAFREVVDAGGVPMPSAEVPLEGIKVLGIPVGSDACLGGGPMHRDCAYGRRGHPS
ncbi:hypothetical protein CYMTET_47990 [Cymbomonas tetramitiformis]|uniref:Uncharacterized protein n=1 Tax=Cymbomonas tetramitiformis TaxID=36881 RepID=A0AAE0EVF7_9CHLO|nr:hypothetical protein CYMTET_47990 [Cymbomonas tetramitiformis]